MALPYVVSAGRHGYHRELPPGIDARHFLSTHSTNVLYGNGVLADQGHERRPHFLGFASVALALIALPALWWTERRRPKAPFVGPAREWPARLWVPIAAGLAVVFLLLALGKDIDVFGHHLGPGPYRLLYEWVPGFQLVRFPQRLALVAMLFVALLAAWSVDALRRRGWVVPALLLAAYLPLEHLSPAFRGVECIPVGDQVPQVYRWLATAPVRALAEAPPHGELLNRKETLEMYFSTFHFKPIVHGFGGYPPAESKRIRRLVLALPEEGALDALGAIGVDTLVVHYPPSDERERYARTVLRRPGYYRGFERLARAGRIRELARFSGPTARVPGGTDVAYRF